MKTFIYSVSPQSTFVALRSLRKPRRCWPRSYSASQILLKIPKSMLPYVLSDPNGSDLNEVTAKSVALLPRLNAFPNVKQTMCVAVH